LGWIWHCPLGVFTGLAVFVPYLGFGLGLVLALLAGLLQFASPHALVMVAVVFGLGQLVESFVLTPRLVGERIGLHPLAVILALMAFGQLLGFVGVLIALPASAVLLVALRRLRDQYLQSDLYQKSGSGTGTSKGLIRHEATGFGHRLGVTPSLDNFFAGPNAAAVSHLRLWTASSRPCHLCPPTCGAKADQAKPFAASGAPPLKEQGTTQWAGSTPTPWTRQSSRTSGCAVLMDDVHLYNLEQQHTAFNWFVNALTPRTGTPRWVLAAGALPPADLKLRDDLRSRLAWGHMDALQVLDEAERRAVLRQEADARGLFLSDEVMSYMLKRFSRDLGQPDAVARPLGPICLANAARPDHSAGARHAGERMKLALFDLDHTLLPFDSDHTWGEFTTELGWNDPGRFHANATTSSMPITRRAHLDIHDYVRFATRAARERGATEAAHAHARYMDEVIRPRITSEALALVRSHQHAGDTVMIVTATNEFVTRPIAQAFGVSELIAVELERDASGWITGEIKGIPSFREGKVTRVEHWLADQGLGWD
jgi:HAD superfamily hydrolase (TIGR01490 family)